jgi:hypothetical protein
VLLVEAERLLAVPSIDVARAVTVHAHY